MTDAVVTRFAPSPTGYLHIGGARTALFNWLYAKGHNGKMLLRVEDTDRARSTDEAITAISEGLNWLGLDWSGEAISQFGNADRHRAVAEELLSSGKAYRCYATAEELTDMREKAKAEGRPPRYDGRWRDRNPDDAPADAPFVVRIKAPKDGETIVEDRVQGTIRFPNKDLDDFVILRSDGSPTYMHAVVVDDHDMAVTHIIRGDDHLTNAARQTIIYKAMGWSVPVMAHVPLIHGPDGAKLSKRHGALGVDAYRDMGYLPSAMQNYLARLGWSHGDEEIFSTEQMIEWFDLSGIGKSASRFDFAKLENLNGHYIRHTSDTELTSALLALLPHLEGGQSILDVMNDERIAQLKMAMPGLKERAKTLVDLVKSASFIWAQRPLDLDEKAGKILDVDARAVLKRIVPVLSDVNDWSVEGTEAAVKSFAETQSLKLGKVAQPLRAALTGTSTSPGIFDVLVVLGKDEALARLTDQAEA
ncbi:MAG: glutamate--tRNA ligase [Stappiaceae bacterium]